MIGNPNQVVYKAKGNSSCVTKISDGCFYACYYNPPRNSNPDGNTDIGPMGSGELAIECADKMDFYASLRSVEHGTFRNLMANLKKRYKS